MRTDAELLAEINADLPDFDWHQGAKDYMDHYYAKWGRGPVERLAFTKPLSDITHEDPEGSRSEIAHYILNFANGINLLKLKRDARVLDVACGGGWVSHWLTKVGYRTFGIDIAPEMIELAKRRISLDPHIRLRDLTPDEVSSMFAVYNLETDPPLGAFRGTFDAAILESALHHFVDPISALRRIREMLKEDGVVLILGEENRSGPIGHAEVEVMMETKTLERSYPRSLFKEVLGRAGFPHVEFLVKVNGLFPESGSSAGQISDLLASATESANECVCATSVEAIQRIVPSFGEVRADAASSKRRSLWSRFKLAPRA